MQKQAHVHTSCVNKYTLLQLGYLTQNTYHAVSSLSSQLRKSEPLIFSSQSWTLQQASAYLSSFSKTRPQLRSHVGRSMQYLPCNWACSVVRSLATTDPSATKSLAQDRHEWWYRKFGYRGMVWFAIISCCLAGNKSVSDLAARALTIPAYRLPSIRIDLSSWKIGRLFA